MTLMNSTIGNEDLFASEFEGRWTQMGKPGEKL